MVFKPRFDSINFGEDPEIEKEIQKKLADTKKTSAVAAGPVTPKYVDDRPTEIDEQQAAAEEAARQAAAEEARRKAAEEAARKAAEEARLAAEAARLAAEEEQQQQQTSGYPKTLYNERGEDVTVNSQAAENQARQRGFTLSSPPT